MQLVVSKLFGDSIAFDIMFNCIHIFNHWYITCCEKNHNGHNHLLRTQTLRPLPCPVRVRRLPRHSRSMHFGDLSRDTQKLARTYNPGQNVWDTSSFTNDMCIFQQSLSPPPPRTVLAVTGQKLWKSLLKFLKFVRGCGGGGKGKQETVES